MDRAIKMLRLSYWTGALADGFFAIALVFPNLWGHALRIPAFQPDAQHRADLGVAASLMLSWAVLLLWADRQPMERKGVLLLTVFPALACLAAAGIFAVISKANALNNMLPVFILQTALAGLFLTSYAIARRAEFTSSDIQKT